MVVAVDEDKASALRENVLVNTLWTLSLVLGAVGLFASFLPCMGGLASTVAWPALGLSLGAIGLGRMLRARAAPAFAALALSGLALMLAPSEREARTDTVPAIVLPPPRVQPAPRAPAPAAPRAASIEVSWHPGPMTTSAFGLQPAATLSLGQLVAAEWEGAWFTARVVALQASGALVHFVGWEPEWDEAVPSSRLRLLPAEADTRPGSSPMPRNRLGSRSVFAPALRGAVYRVASNFDLGSSTEAGGAAREQSALTPDAHLGTLYASRLDVAQAPSADAFDGLNVSTASALLVEYTGTFNLASASPIRFLLTSDGETSLTVDGQPFNASSSGAASSLTAGVHQLRARYLHRGGGPVSLSLQLSRNTEDPRVFDMNRFAATQVVRESGGTVRLTMSEGVLFDFANANLKPEAEAALSEIKAAVIEPSGELPIVIEGHTDDRGTEAYNLDLSRRRAESVAKWLTQHGVPARRIRTEALGTSRPRMPNDTDAGRAANRRVEVVAGKRE